MAVFPALSIFSIKVLKEIREKHTWNDVLLAAQGVSYADQCLEAMKADLAANAQATEENVRSLVDFASGLKYVKSQPLQISMPDGNLRLMVMEPMIEGDFYKINSNRHDGGGFKTENSPLAIAGQAFTCFSYCTFTNSTAMCTDVQGIGSVLFDPAWITKTDPDDAEVPFGLGNVGNLTMKTFFKKHDHKNNALCHLLRTTPPLPASFLFANLTFIVDIDNQEEARKLRKSIRDFGGTTTAVPISNREKVYTLSASSLV